MFFLTLGTNVLLTFVRYLGSYCFKDHLFFPLELRLFLSLLSVRFGIAKILPFS